MTPVLEGTWQEIVARATEFEGKRLRVTILGDESTESLRGESVDVQEELERPDAQSDFEREQRRLHEVALGLIGKLTDLPSDLSERVEELWQRSVEEEYERQSK